jgi:hypothetical protein
MPRSEQGPLPMTFRCLGRYRALRCIDDRDRKQGRIGRGEQTDAVVPVPLEQQVGVDAVRLRQFRD